MAKQSQLTKEYFDKQLGRLEKTVNKGIAFTIHNSESLGRLEKVVTNIKEVQDSHTTTLDATHKNSEHWRTEAAALHSITERHEQWITQIASKIGIKLEPEA